MSTPKHTPLPWIWIYEEPQKDWALIMSGGKAGQIVANVNTKSCHDSASAPAFRQMPAEANARLIVQAVNSHAALVEALRGALLDCETLNAQDYRPGAQCTLTQMIENITAALALAEGKQ